MHVLDIRRGEVALPVVPALASLEAVERIDRNERPVEFAGAMGVVESSGVSQ